MSSPENILPERKNRMPSPPDIKKPLVPVYTRDTVGSALTQEELAEIAEENRLALETSKQMASAQEVMRQDSKKVVENSQLSYREEQKIKQQVKEAGGVGMSGEVTGFVTEADKQKAEWSKTDHPVFAYREETVKTLTDRLNNFLARKKELSFFSFGDLKMRKILNAEIEKTENALNLKRTEVAREAKIKESNDSETKLADKEKELALSPAWQIFRRAGLRKEIADLRKKVAQEKVILAIREK